MCTHTLQEKFIYEHHQFMGHVGFPRIWEHMDVKFLFGCITSARRFAREVMGACETCQACQRPRSLKAPIKSTPIPPAVMCSVCIALFFSLPLVDLDGQILDTLIVCVDRHSGWIVAIPEGKVGLTRAKVALAMVKY